MGVSLCNKSVHAAQSRVTHCVALIQAVQSRATCCIALIQAAQFRQSPGHRAVLHFSRWRSQADVLGVELRCVDPGGAVKGSVQAKSLALCCVDPGGVVQGAGVGPALFQTDL
jgi:hypothetical protein